MDVPQKKLIRNVAASYIGILVISGLLSLILHFDFGTTLFFLGLLVGGGGAMLGGSLSPITRSQRNPTDRYSNRPNEELTSQIASKVAHSLPPDAFENVMMFAGLAALISSLPFVLLIMFGK